jgi:DNA (cytosine-5)-methyltransferase 1
MSKNGAGKLLNEIRSGNRPKMDERNRLIIPAVQIIDELKPKFFILENVPEMKETVILDTNEKPVRILDYVRDTLDNYHIQYKEMKFADYGIGQNRNRLITIGMRTENTDLHLFPAQTHSSKDDSGLLPHVTLRDLIERFPKISARKGEESAKDFHPYHYVSVLDEKKMFWISHTPEGKTAFDNQCCNPECMFEGNITHSAKRTNGINRASGTTPIYCKECDSLLPRPTTGDHGQEKLMKGFTSAYRRMKWDSIAPALTQNLGYPSSDTKLHPTQDRVLSIAEAMVIQGIPDDYSWYCVDKLGIRSKAKTTLIRDSIGESVPPPIIRLLVNHLQNLT